MQCRVPEITDAEGDSRVAVVVVSEGELAVDKSISKQVHQSADEDVKEVVLQYQKPGLREGEKRREDAHGCKVFPVHRIRLSCI